MNAIRLILILGSLLPGSGYTDAVEIPAPEDGFRCFCYPSKVVPAVYYGHQIKVEVVRV